MTNKRFAFALHGGAGARSGRDYSVAEYHMRELTENARDRLSSGARALDVVEYAVAQMESSGLYVAGRGSAPNSAGYVELDASIMDGPVSAAGAVSCIRDIVNPISVARRVMEATPHVMLSGAGALAFARAQGFEEVEDHRRQRRRGCRQVARHCRCGRAGRQWRTGCRDLDGRYVRQARRPRRRYADHRRRNLGR